MKATYGEVLINECGKCYHNRMECLKHGYPYSEAMTADDGTECMPVIEAREIYKDPITDSGEKKSAKGLLRVDYNEQGEITLYQQQTKEQEKQGLLETVFLNGKLVKMQTLTEIRNRLQATL